MKHRRTAGSSNEFKRSSFLDALKKATAVNVLSHGFPGGLYEQNPATQSNTASLTDIQSVVGQASWMPSLNIVYAAACSTQNTLLVSAFFGNVPGTNKAYVGFTRDARVDGFPASALSFWQALRDGAPAIEATRDAWEAYMDAVRRANTRLRASGITPNATPGLTLTLIGDPGARLMGVYGAAAGTFSWWRVY